MTYLNDVKEGGSTYFSHYDLEIEPRKGLTLIWPAEWTHAHRGNILKAGKKNTSLRVGSISLVNVYTNSIL